ncbi:GntR family transcriptional regulator [Streptomyces gilvosporeus]|uniref:GntR family transcriptional regulator n=1 Tax=Streptomyces gilvosporeus TaxID=553510 RepID=A0A1V0TY12_9ACTN|nr:GntR family transcriptional regulator [Streptomyces gilvosporeus]
MCTAIRDDIVSGALAPGSRLVEEILAARYGVSRVPVREALRTLQSEGFVTTRRHAGACVAEPTEQEAADLLDIRAVLEPLGAARAAVRRSPAHLKVLRGLVRLGRERARHGHAADLRQLDGWFHETLAQAAGSPSLTALLTQLRRKVEWMYTVEGAPRAGESWDEHGAVLDAVARGDAERARALMAAHIERSLPVHRLRRPAPPAVRDAKRPVNTARARN